MPKSSEKVPLETSAKISWLILLNYRYILQKESINLSNVNVYKQILRDHLPQLLDYWAIELIDSQITEGQNLKYSRKFSKK